MCCLSEKDQCAVAHAAINLGLSKDAECVSRKTVVFGCVRKIEAGTIGLISPAKQSLTACALRASGATQIISLALRIWRTDIEIACLGTSASVGNQPSPTC